MADISKITLPNGSSYDIKDATARAEKQNIRNGTIEGAVDWNTLTTAGTYKIQNTTMTADYNAPVGEYKFGMLVVFDSEKEGSKRIMQIYFPHIPSKNYMCIRMRNSNVWTDWKGLSKDADTVDGKHASDFAAASHAHTNYATCATGRATVDKVATLANFTLTVGATVVVEFTDTAGTTNPTSGCLTLNVNNTGPMPIVYSHRGVRYYITYTDASSFYNNKTHIFTYDGAYWICMDWNAYTTYGVATSSTLGLVKSGTDITVDSSGNVSVNDDSHNHVISNVDGLQSALDGKAASSHTHSSYVNQNAFSNITVGSTTVSADSATDTLTLVAGSNITITPDATNDKITIASTNTWRGIQNNLKSDSTTDSLSAAQGKVLKNLVDNKAALSHIHTKSQITDFPSSLPANGGNADTVGGFTAYQFVLGAASVKLTTSINEYYTAGTHSVEEQYTPDFPVGYGSYGLLDIRVYGSIVYQTIRFENGNIINRARVIGATDWTEWAEIYTSENKPYITGYFSGTTADFNFNDRPSFAIVNDSGNIKFGFIYINIDSHGNEDYSVLFDNLSDSMHEYIIFK